MRFFLLSFFVLVSLSTFSQKKVKIYTNYGKIVIKLYDAIPLHRDNFIRMVREKYYDSILFHRVIKNFVIQAGDPDSKTAKAGEPLGENGAKNTIPAEFRNDLFHRRGSVGAARDNNPEKASSGSHFYIVIGKTYSDLQLDSLEQKRMNGNKIPEEYRKEYREKGGIPWLDQQYTIFGEVVKGMKTVDKIDAVATDKADRPIKDVRIRKMKLLH